MEQLNLFNFEMKFDEFKLIKKEMLVKTLKREVKRRVYDPDAIEGKLRDTIGTLYLHQLKLKEYSGRWSEYYSYLLERIYKHFFKELVENLSPSNYEDIFGRMESLLSDEEVEVKLVAETGRHVRMVKGFAFNIEVKSDELIAYYLTGSQYKNKKHHLTRRYFTNDRSNSIRTLGDITRILSELLLMKELRHYFSKKDNRDVYKEILKSNFVNGDVLYVDLEIMSNEPVIIDSLNEMAALKKLTVKETSSRGIYTAIMGYFERIKITSLRMFFHDPDKSNIKQGARRSYMFETLSELMVTEVVPKVHEVEVHMKQLKKSSGDYAATYELKKNIPQKVLDRMKSSPLLDYFYEIEYDELVELENISTFEREIISFIKTFKVPVPSNATFKVRRLGKIKAAGVFYPLFNTLAVDINHPNAFIHEYWHMVDYYMMDNKDEFTGQRLSSRRDFEHIIKEYKRVVLRSIQALGSDSPVRTAFYGKTKYNKEYYFENTEIFARCAEMFFSNALNGKSSLVEEKESVYYPNEDTLKVMIEKYFSNLLKEANHEKTNAA